MEGGPGWPGGRSRDGGVDEVPLAPMVRGRVFMCGKHAIAPDPDGLLERISATTVVCLNETYELNSRYPEYIEWLRANRPRRALHHPIPDMHAPELDDLAELIEELMTRLAEGDAIVVHCGAGIGRTGTVVAALLMRMGEELADALAIVRAHRPMAGPEVGVQTDVLVAYAFRLSLEGP